MLREANDRDVWRFVTPTDVAEALPRIGRRVGRRPLGQGRRLHTRHPAWLLSTFPLPAEARLPEGVPLEEAAAWRDALVVRPRRLALP